MIILAIDPGNTESAYCFVDAESLQLGAFGKVENKELLSIINLYSYDVIVIERVASYGMTVGRDVFETCEWVGRFTQAALPLDADYVYRKDVKLHICGDSRANDTNIRHALIDRFARHDFKRGKGTKKNPDFFYGFHRDVWQAFAVGLTFTEISIGKRT